MPTITLTLPTSGTVITAGLHSNNYSALQTLLNGGLDNNNILASAGIVLSKLGQSGAVTSQAPVWNGSAWVPAYPPGFEFSYDEFVANVGTAATTEATATTIKTATAVTFDGATTVEIEFSCMEVTVAANAAGNACILVLYEDGVAIGKIGSFETGATTQFGTPVRVGRRRTPAAGARTYSVRAYHTNASCTFNAGAGGVGNPVPGYIKIKKA